MQKFEYAEDAGAEAFRKDIAIMEAGLKKLEAQEQKYSAELDKALDEYAELKAQAADFDSVELYKARQAIREEIERSAVDRIKSAYGDKYDPVMMLFSKRDAAKLLSEEVEEPPVRESMRQKQKKQQVQQKQKKKSQDGWER